MPNESDILGGQTRAAPPQLSDGVRTHRCGCEVSQNIGEGNDTASTVSEASSRNMNSIRVESRDGENSSVTENTIATTANIDLDVPEYDASVTTIDDTASELTDAGVLVFNNTNNRSPILQGCCTCKHCTCRQCRLRQLICTLADIGSGVAASGRSAPSPPMADSDSSGETSLASSALLGAHWRSETADLAHMGGDFSDDVAIAYDAHLDFDMVAIVVDDEEVGEDDV